MRRPRRHRRDHRHCPARGTAILCCADGAVARPHNGASPLSVFEAVEAEFSHYPPEKIAFKMRTPTWCRDKAAEIGPACQAVITELLEVNALFRLRAAQGVVGLADKHGPERAERACAKAIAVGDPSYRTIKGILAAGLEADPPAPAAGDGGAAAFLHGPSRLFQNVVALPTTDHVLDEDTAVADDQPGQGVTA